MIKKKTANTKFKLLRMIIGSEESEVASDSRTRENLRIKKDR